MGASSNRSGYTTYTTHYPGCQCACHQSLPVSFLRCVIKLAILATSLSYIQGAPPPPLNHQSPHKYFFTRFAFKILIAGPPGETRRCPRPSKHTLKYVLFKFYIMLCSHTFNSNNKSEFQWMCFVFSGKLFCVHDLSSVWSRHQVKEFGFNLTWFSWWSVYAWYGFFGHGPLFSHLERALLPDIRFLSSWLSEYDFQKAGLT